MWVAWHEHFLWSLLDTADSITPVSLLESARFPLIIFLVIYRWGRTLAGDKRTSQQVRPYIRMHLPSVKPMFAPGSPPTPPLDPSPTATTPGHSPGSLPSEQRLHPTLLRQLWRRLHYTPRSSPTTLPPTSRLPIQHGHTQQWWQLPSRIDRYSVQERNIRIPTPQEFLILEHLTRIYGYILLMLFDISFSIQTFLCLSI